MIMPLLIVIAWFYKWQVFRLLKERVVKVTDHLTSIASLLEVGTGTETQNTTPEK